MTGTPAAGAPARPSRLATPAARWTGLEGFAGPFGPFNTPLLAAVVTEHSAAVARLFVDRHREEIAARSAGLVEAIEAWAAEPVSPPPLDPAFGDGRYGLTHEPPGGAPAVAAAMGLCLAAAGVPAHWRVALPRPYPFRWQHHLLPDSRRLSVDVSARDGGGVTLDSRIVDVSDPRRPTGDGLVPLPQIALGPLRCTLLPRAALSLPAPEHVTDNALEVLPPGTVQAVADSFALLADATREYLDWVARVLSHMFLLRPLNGAVESGSLENYLGLIHVSAYDNPVALAELMIHESSHQYFNVLCLLGPFDDGSDTTEYYSPAVKRARPLNRVAIAYHAFGNVYLYYRKIVDAGLDRDDWCARHLETWDVGLRQLQQPLLGNPALTDIGRALCEPLAAQLQLANG